MKKMFFFVAFAALYLIPCNSSSFNSNNQVEKTLIFSSINSEPDTSLVIEPVDPEYGSNCLTDRNWKRGAMIKEYRTYFSNPQDVTVNNCEVVNFTLETPLKIIREYENLMFQINMEYERCLKSKQ